MGTRTQIYLWVTRDRPYTHIDTLGIDYHPDPTDTSVQRVSAFANPLPTSGPHTLMPTTSVPLIDTSSRVNDPSHGGHDPACQLSCEAHNASIQNCLETMMEEMGVMNPARRQAMYQKILEKVEMYFACRGPIGKWSKNIESFAVKYAKELVAIRARKKAKQAKQLQEAVTNESKNDLIVPPQLRTMSEFSKFVTGRNMDTSVCPKVVGRPIIGLLSQLPTLSSSVSKCISETTWRSHHAPTLCSWWIQHTPALHSPDGQVGCMPTNSSYSKCNAVSSWCRNVAEALENVERICSPVSSVELPSMALSKSYSEDLDHIYDDPNEDTLPQDSSNENISSEFPYQPPSEVDSYYQVDITVDIPTCMVEDNHVLALVQVLPPDTDLSDVPKNVDIYHINTEDASVFRDDPPLSDESSNDYNHYKDNS